MNLLTLQCWRLFVSFLWEGVPSLGAVFSAPCRFTLYLLWLTLDLGYKSLSDEEFEEALRKFEETLP